MKMIDECECIFFLNTENSITCNDVFTKTSSPWIYNELMTMQYIRKKLPQYLEKDNLKIYQYFAVGFNESNIRVYKDFINKSKVLKVSVKGDINNDFTEFKNKLDISIDVDYNIYNKVTWTIQDGLLYITLHEIINEEPNVELVKE
jgi:hypothetical protein